MLAAGAAPLLALALRLRRPRVDAEEEALRLLRAAGHGEAEALEFVRLAARLEAAAPVADRLV
jgi:hypothetical protein